MSQFDFRIKGNCLVIEGTKSKQEKLTDEITRSLIHELFNTKFV